MANTRKDRKEKQQEVIVSIPEKIKRKIKGSKRYKRENRRNKNEKEKNT